MVRHKHNYKLRPELKFWHSPFMVFECRICGTERYFLRSQVRALLTGKMKLPW